MEKAASQYSLIAADEGTFVYTAVEEVLTSLRCWLSRNRNFNNKAGASNYWSAELGGGDEEVGKVPLQTKDWDQRCVE